MRWCTWTMSRKRSHEDDSSDSSSDREDSEQQHESTIQDDSDPEEPSVLAGNIENVTVVNFLCHRHLTVPFGPRVNFLIGRNGSGKSAVLTGIVVALGGRATHTSRGANIKNFVKKGCSSCRVSVQLCNKGWDAFKKDNYGPSIIVERRILIDGGSSYSIKSSEGKVISTSKTELDNILDHFNIQIDNPVCLLNQDTSRNLLNTNNSSDLYKFFMKATGLEQLSSDYNFVMEQKSIAVDTLQRKEKAIPEVREEVKKLETKYMGIKQVKEAREQMEELKKQRVWAEVIEHEKEVPKQDATVKKLQSGLPKFDKEIEDCEENLAELEEKVRRAEVEVSQIKEQAQSLQNAQRQIVDDLKDKKKAAKEKQSNVRRLQSDIKEAMKDKRILQEKIEQIRNSMEMRDLEEERSQRDLVLEQKRKESNTLQLELENLTEHMSSLEGEERKCRDQLAKLRHDEKEFPNLLRELKKSLNRAHSSTSSRLAKFGDWMPPLVNAINIAVQQMKFRRTPRGPIGAHIHLRDQKWSRAVEKSLKNLGTAFCVGGHEDCRVLKNIMTQKCKHFFPPVVVCPFQDEVYDVSLNKPQCQFPSVLDMLDIDDPVIANCLIDQLQIERILLIENNSEARDVIFSKQPPAKQAYTEGGDCVIGRPCPKWISAHGKVWNYLSSSSKDEIRFLTQEISEKEKQFNRITTLRNDAESSLQQKCTEIREARNRKKKIQESFNHLSMEINELVESREEEVSLDVTVLESDLEQRIERIEELSAKTQSAQEEMTYATTVVQLQETKYEEHKTRISGVLEHAEPLKEELQSLQLMCDQEKLKKAHVLRERSKLEQKITNHEQERDRLIKLAEQKAELASRHYQRVETTRTVKSLETEILRKEKRIEEEERNRGNVEEVLKQYEETYNKYTKILNSRRNIQKYTKKLEEAMDRRMKDFISQRRYLAMNTSHFFTANLSQRGFSGYISFDHIQETLNLIVNVHKGPNVLGKGVDESTAVMKTLSGGERSVATICFLTSLWGLMESPFRCLDEFDVFMDLWNRKIIMKMVLTMAALKKDHQFIFLTPQDLSSLPMDKKMVKILKLDNPEG